jgi:hypothetical protein
MVTLFTVDAVVVTRIVPAIALALDTVAILATRMQHVTCLLTYHTKHSTDCDSVYSGYHCNHGIPPAFVPSCAFHLRTLLIHNIVTAYLRTVGGSPLWHNTCTKFCSYQSNSSLELKR